MPVLWSLINPSHDHRYWQDPEQTRKAIETDEEGTQWMHTGDEGIMDDEGYLKSKIIQSSALKIILTDP
jgi:acyl-CoA synthetase (AMP-forming)/AMP-acid ligase II